MSCGLSGAAVTICGLSGAAGMICGSSGAAGMICGSSGAAGMICGFSGSGGMVGVLPSVGLLDLGWLGTGWRLCAVPPEVLGWAVGLFPVMSWLISATT